MKCFFISLGIMISTLGSGQHRPNYTALPLVPYKPLIYVNGIDQRNILSRSNFLTHGLKVILQDKSFKIKEFTILYDCHSRSLFDFYPIRYIGDSVEAKDKYLQNLTRVGDNVTFQLIVIEKEGQLFIMKNLDCMIRD